MKTRTWTLATALMGCWTLQSCERASQPPATSETPSETRGEQDDYPITGRVTAVAPDRTAVTLDHQDIAGLMEGMEMEFTVEDSKILEEIDVGNEVQGRLRVGDGKYIITELRKR